MPLNENADAANASNGQAPAAESKAALQGSDVDLSDVEPWPEAVNGADALNEVAETFDRYIALPDGAADALALWCAHTHVYDAFECSPRLNVSSPDKQCGKTTLREVVSLFVRRPVLAENLTVAVLFRLIESKKPTVLADECDSWLRDNEELRGILNSGHRRGGKSYRCQGDNYAVRAFDVFAPVVLCGIGSLPGTLHDRSIEVALKRAKHGESRQRFDSRRTQREQELCRKLARFCADNRATLEASDPTLPPGAYNRVADNWRPLLAIAEVAGGDWPRRAATAVAKLHSRKDTDAQGIGVMLLADIRQVLREGHPARIFSKDLIAALIGMTDRPWLEAHRGRAINENWLARQLRSFDVRPKDIRMGENHAKGYEAADFVEPFERYLSDGDRDNVTMPANAGESEFSKCDNSETCRGLDSPRSGENTDVSRCHDSERVEDAALPFTEQELRPATISRA
mgnify:CR=1 FL=1